MTTITYVAAPIDRRCRWWSMVLPDGDVAYALTGRIDAPYLRDGDDLELEPGTMLLDSEEAHHRQARGYVVNLGVAIDDSVVWIRPTLARKMWIKTHSGADLMAGSGDIAGAIRMAVWLRRQPDLTAAVDALLAI